VLKWHLAIFSFSIMLCENSLYLQLLLIIPINN
jgi:hypothetical protein